MNVFEGVKKLTSFSEADDKEVPRKKIGRVIEAGRFAPSPGSVQSVEFVVVESEQNRELLAEAAGDQRIEEAPVSIVVLGDIGRMARKVGRADCESACNSEVACAVQNMRLVAEEEGLGSCWISGFDQLQIKQGLDIPDEKEPLAIVSLCYSNSEYEQSKKFGLGEVCYYESYGNYMESVFDDLQWKGAKRQREIAEKRFKGFISKLMGG